MPVDVVNVLLQWYIRLGTSEDERRAIMPGDEIVPEPQTSYARAITIAAKPSDIWPWLVQIGQGRGGFYTHEWVENLLGAHIRDASRIVRDGRTSPPATQFASRPIPIWDSPVSTMTVSEIQAARALVFRQTLPNGSIASWAFLLDARDDGTTRLVIRRRAGRPTVFDRVMKPGYVFMDRGMLRGIRARGEGRLTPQG